MGQSVALMRPQAQIQRQEESYHFISDFEGKESLKVWTDFAF